MNAVELLLKMDKGKVKAIPTKQVEVKRLSGIAGEPFIVTLKAISSDKIEEISEMFGESSKADGDRYLVYSAWDMTKDERERFREAQKEYGAATPTELIGAIFTAGEVASLAKTIAVLSGIGVDTIEEVKN